MYFEPLTYVPIDLDAINPDLMSREERKMRNKYHKAVYKKVSPYLNSKDKEWLGKYTQGDRGRQREVNPFFPERNGKRV